MTTSTTRTDDGWCMDDVTRCYLYGGHRGPCHGRPATETDTEDIMTDDEYRTLRDRYAAATLARETVKSRTVS